LIDKGEIPIFEITDRITTQRPSQKQNIHKYVSIKNTIIHFNDEIVYPIILFIIQMTSF